MTNVLVGSEAMKHGGMSEYELRRRYRTLLPGVYFPKRLDPTLRDRTVAAWMWSRRRAVVAGVAASALHGSRWVDASTPIELISVKARPHPGVVVRTESVPPDETTRMAGLPVTTVARTAFDLGRHLPRGEALERLDALMRASRFSVEAVDVLAARHRGARGVRQLRALLPLVDAGAASPRETWLRLLLIDAGFPRPVTQIPVVQGWRPLAMLDMGWEEYLVAAEYDGDHHRSDRRQYVKDLRRLRMLEKMGWLVVRVVAEDAPSDIIARVGEALHQRGLRRK